MTLITGRPSLASFAGVLAGLTVPRWSAKACLGVLTLVIMAVRTHIIPCLPPMLAPLQHVDLFSKDFVFVPIHEALHWSLAVICHPGAVAGPGYAALIKASSGAGAAGAGAGAGAPSTTPSPSPEPGASSGGAEAEAEDEFFFLNGSPQAGAGAGAVQAAAQAAGAAAAAAAGLQGPQEQRDAAGAAAVQEAAGDTGECIILHFDSMEGRSIAMTVSDARFAKLLLIRSRLWRGVPNPRYPTCALTHMHHAVMRPLLPLRTIAPLGLCTLHAGGHESARVFEHLRSYLLHEWQRKAEESGDTVARRLDQPCVQLFA